MGPPDIYSNAWHLLRLAHDTTGVFDKRDKHLPKERERGDGIWDGGLSDGLSIAMESKSPGTRDGRLSGVLFGHGFLCLLYPPHVGSDTKGGNPAGKEGLKGLAWRKPCTTPLGRGGRCSAR